MGIFRHIGGLLTGKGHLCLAADEGNLDKCSKLVDLGSDVNEVDGWGNHPLYVAASRGHTRVVRWLLGAGADPDREKDTKGQGGGTALHVAARKGHTECCRMLVEAGTDEDHIASAGMEANFAGQGECAALLMAETEVREERKERRREGLRPQFKELWRRGVRAEDAGEIRQAFIAYTAATKLEMEGDEGDAALGASSRTYEEWRKDRMGPERYAQAIREGWRRFGVTSMELGEAHGEAEKLVRETAGMR